MLSMTSALLRHGCEDFRNQLFGVNAFGFRAEIGDDAMS